MRRERNSGFDREPPQPKNRKQPAAIILETRRIVKDISSAAAKAGCQ
jgi:hypothetical protein